MERQFRLIFFFVLTLGVINVAAQEETALPTPPPINLDCEGDEVICCGTYLFNFNVSVNSEKAYLKGLRRQDFKVLLNNRPAEVEFFSKNDEPINVVFVFDRSGSSSITRREANELMFAVEGVADFINRSYKKNQYSFIAFDEQAKLIQSFTENTDEVRRALKAVINYKAKGQTGFYDSIDFAIKEAKKGKLNRKVVIVISDGQDNSSKLRFGKLRKIARRNNYVQIHAVDFLTSTSEFSSGRARQADNELRKLVSYSGGSKYTPVSKRELRASFRLIAEELNNQFVIGISQESEKKRSQWHKLKLSLNKSKAELKELGKLRIKFPQGYYY